MRIITVDDDTMADAQITPPESRVAFTSPNGFAVIRSVTGADLDSNRLALTYTGELLVITGIGLRWNEGGPRTEGTRQREIAAIINTETALIARVGMIAVYRAATQLA